MLDGDAFAHEIAALLIADIKTSGARTRGELEEACRISLEPARRHRGAAADRRADADRPGALAAGGGEGATPAGRVGRRGLPAQRPMTPVPPVGPTVFGPVFGAGVAAWFRWMSIRSVLLWLVCSWRRARIWPPVSMDRLAALGLFCCTWARAGVAAVAARPRLAAVSVAMRRRMEKLSR